jgi:hypothetical protein
MNKLCLQRPMVSLIKPTDALFSQIYFVKKLYMFRAVSLPIIRIFPLYIRHWYMSCMLDDNFQARLVVLENIGKILGIYWWWKQKQVPKRCLWRNRDSESVHRMGQWRRIRPFFLRHKYLIACNRVGGRKCNRPNPRNRQPATCEPLLNSSLHNPF